MEQIRQLLNEIQRLTVKNEALRKEKLAKGETFNLFSELGMSTDEVHLHSAFLAMLLNPRSNHGQQDKFLIPFVKMLDEKSQHLSPLNMDTSNAEAYIEYYIGPVRGEHGGRLDIYITDKRKCRVVIENKIGAGDQPKQLKRYWNFAQEKCKRDPNKYRIVYLTLDGHEPSETSTSGLKQADYICLSYKTDILPWLEQCVALSVRQPLLRETVNQYIEIIKQLTYSDMENTNDVLKIMSKEEYLDAVFAIANNVNAMIDNIMNDILYPQLKSLAEEKGFTLLFEKGAGWMTESYVGWCFVNPEWKHFNLKMEFEKRGLGDLIIGFCIKEGQKREEIECWDELWERTTTIAKNNLYWIYRKFPQYEWWDNPRSLKAITDGRTMVNVIGQAIDEFIQYANGLDV